MPQEIRPEPQWAKIDIEAAGPGYVRVTINAPGIGESCIYPIDNLFTRVEVPIRNMVQTLCRRVVRG